MCRFFLSKLRDNSVTGNVKEAVSSFLERHREMFCERVRRRYLATALASWRENAKIKRHHRVVVARFRAYSTTHAERRMFLRWKAVARKLRSTRVAEERREMEAEHIEQLWQAQKAKWGLLRGLRALDESGLGCGGGGRVSSLSLSLFLSFSLSLSNDVSLSNDL